VALSAPSDHHSGMTEAAERSRRFGNLRCII
jgi:hypothetical protein